MNKLNQKQKIASYIKVEVALSKDVTIIDVPGEFVVQMNDTDKGKFEDVHANAIEITDVLESDKPYCSQKATITLSGAATIDRKVYEDKDVILRATQTDGTRMIIGNNDFPIRLFIEQSGKPVITKLTFDHKHPEHIKESI